MKPSRSLFLLLPPLLALLVYLPSLQRGLIWDSRPMIEENDLLKGGFSPAAPFASGYWQTTSQRGAGYDYYRPLTVLTFMIEKQAWGLSPWRLRLVNLLLFALALAALLLFLRRLPAPPGAAEAASLLFALFPLHVDNVNWVVGRCDLLMLLFGILSLLLFDLFLERRSPWSGLAALAAWSLALLAKEASLFFLPLFPLHEFLRRRRLTPLLYLPLLLTGAGYWLLKSTVIGRSGFPVHGFASLGENVMAPLAALGYYLRSLVFPFSADMFLSLEAVRTPLYIAAGTIFAMLLALAPAWVLLRSRPGSPAGAAVAGAWFWTAPFLGGALLMVFTPIHPYSISTRYLMVPAIGCCWLLGVWLASLRPLPRRALLLLLLSASALAVTVGSKKYRDEEAFWRSALASSPKDSFFMSQYAAELERKGDHLAGEALLRRALKFRMKQATAAAVSLRLADAAIAGARYDEALSWLQRLRSLPLGPQHAAQGRRLLLRVHRARDDLAAAEAVLAEISREEGGGAAILPQVATYLAFAAWERAREALAERRPDEAALLRQIAETEGAFRAQDEAGRVRYFIGRGNFAAAWRLWPGKDAPGIRQGLGAAQLALLAGEESEGRRRIGLLARDHANDVQALNSIGNLLYDLRRGEEALPFYRRSLALRPGQPALAGRVGRIAAALDLMDRPAAAGGG